MDNIFNKWSAFKKPQDIKTKPLIKLDTFKPSITRKQRRRSERMLQKLKSKLAIK